jgi:hypothetical protein
MGVSSGTFLLQVEINPMINVYLWFLKAKEGIR